MHWYIWLIMLFVPLSFALALWGAARMSGWKRLADRFPGSVEGERNLEKAGGMTLRLNHVAYNNSVRLRANEDGLQLSAVFPLNWFHRPVFIPWEELQYDSEFKGLLGNSTRLRIWLEQKPVSLIIRGGLEEKFLKKVRGMELDWGRDNEWS